MNDKYIPALGFDGLTFIYDFLIGNFTPEKKFKTALLQQANIGKEHKILDFGTGTATLAIIAKQIFPDATITGIDVDMKIISIAEKKIQKAKADVELLHYEGRNLPLADASFDRVISSLVFHHLKPQQKKNSLKEIYRVLKQGGELHIADWGKPQNFLMRIGFLFDQMLDGTESTVDHLKGKFPEYIADAGFSDISVTKNFSTVAGTLSLFKAVKNN